MSNEVTKTQERITDGELLMHLENLGLIKELTKGEQNTFMQIAKAFNLNPFKREIWVSKYNGQMSIITGYETYIKRAERSGVLDGWEVKTEGEGNALKAIITIYRKDRSRPFIWEVKYSEYVQKTKEGNVNKFWQKAETMTKKVAMAQGFRLCFNDELGGMPYTSEEMPETHDVQHEEIKTTPEQKKKSKLSKKAFEDAITRVKAGEVQLIEMIKSTFDLSKEEVDTLEGAVPVIVAEPGEGATIIGNGAQS